MAAYRRGRFSWRAFVSLYITWSALILLISGVILYIAPAGRIAKWTHISLLGLEKKNGKPFTLFFHFYLLLPSAFICFTIGSPLFLILKINLKSVCIAQRIVHHYALNNRYFCTDLVERTTF